MKDKAIPHLSDTVGLPLFTYHPDPLATGSVEASGARCACCGRERGYIYTAAVHAEEDLTGQLCPWCIAEGVAAERFGARYADSAPLIEAALPEEIIEEVTQRTPGYRSWQPDEWKCCCGDACEFHGNPDRSHLGLLAASAVEQFLSLTKWSPEQWLEFVSDLYEPGGSPGVYHFVCRHCNKPRYGLDSDGKH